MTEIRSRPGASLPRRMDAPYRGERYYGESPLKPAPWNWMVSGYIFLAGLSGAAQGLAAIGQSVDRRRWRTMMRDARLIAAGGTAAGAVLLIADLRTPRRWYNMLRILRPTSPMSFGTYILGGFGLSTAVSLLGELPRRLGGGSPRVQRFADAAQIGAGLFGVGASTYTAALLSATSAPAWASRPRGLGAEFGISAVGSGAAALALCQRMRGRGHEAERLEMVAAVASAAELALEIAPSLTEPRRTDAPAPSLRKRPDVTALALAAAPLAAYGLARALPGRAPAFAAMGSLAVLAGGMALRHRRLKEGMASGTDAGAYFELAQPDRVPDGSSRRRRDRLEGGRRERS